MDRGWMDVWEGRVVCVGGPCLLGLFSVYICVFLCVWASYVANYLSIELGQPGRVCIYRYMSGQQENYVDRSPNPPPRGRSSGLVLPAHGGGSDGG